MMNSRQFCTGLVALVLFSFASVIFADATPRKVPSVRTSFRIGTPNYDGTTRGGGFTMCDLSNTLVSENLDMSTITPLNSISCFGGSGTPEHSYGRSQI